MKPSLQADESTQHEPKTPVSATERKSNAPQSEFIALESPLKSPSRSNLKVFAGSFTNLSEIHLTSADVTNLNTPVAALNHNKLFVLPHSRKHSVKPAPVSRKIPNKQLPSAWTYLKQELNSGNFEDSFDSKSERVANFLSVPLQLEKVIYYGSVVNLKLLWLGYMICLDSFLHIFTILPLRILISLWSLFKFIVPSFNSEEKRLKPAQVCDLLKGILLLLCSFMLMKMDASQLYHSVRGQSVVKLYVIFNVLEVFFLDKI